MMQISFTGKEKVYIICDMSLQGRSKKDDNSMAISHL